MEQQKHTANSKYEIPTLVPVEHEQSDMPVLDYYRTQDLIIVPVTQIAPSGLCTPVPDQQQEELPLPPHDQQSGVQ